MRVGEVRQGGATYSDLFVSLDDITDAINSGALRTRWDGDVAEFSVVDLLVWSINERLRLERAAD